MKLFETPELEVIKFAVTDVITTSMPEDDDPPPASYGQTNCI